MADDDNLILRLLREIRADTQETRSRLARVERTLDEMKESVVAAMGVAAYASSATESHGHDMDEMKEKIALLERRLADLETNR